VASAPHSHIEGRGVPGGKLELTLTDVYGKPIQQKVNIFLRHLTLSDDRVVRDVDGSKRIVVTGLQRAPQGTYRIEIDALSYQTVSQFVNIPSGRPARKTYTLPVNKDRVVAVRFPPLTQLSSVKTLLEISAKVLGFVDKTGQALYGALDNTRRAGLLNMAAKAERTRLNNNRTVFSYITELREIRGDRFYAKIDPALRSETKNAISSGLFHEVSGALHKPVPPFEPAGSFKTYDRYGNLQLTFSVNRGNNEWMVDLDIDDAQGFGHIFQVLRNIGGSTHPYDIHEILVGFQEIDPGYRFVL